MKRRGFIGSLAAIGFAPLIPTRVLVALLPAIPILYGDGLHDDTAALNVWGAGRRVKRPSGAEVGPWVEGGRFLVSDTINITRQDSVGIVGNRFDPTPEWSERLAAETKRYMERAGLSA